MYTHKRARNYTHKHAFLPPFLLENIIPVTVPFSPPSFNSRSGIMWTSEMRRERVPKVVPFLVPFWSSFGFQNGTQNGAKSGSEYVNF